MCAAAWSCAQEAEDDRSILSSGGSSSLPVGGNIARGGRLASGGSQWTNPEISIGGTSGPGAAGSGGSAVCNAQVREGQRVPVDMYFLVDSSGSMREQVTGGTKWDMVSTALIAFLNDPRNTGTGVGIGYFPQATGACTVGQPGCFCIPVINICFATEGGSCSVSDYSTAAVPLALPPPLSAVVADITGHQVSGGTPTRPALEGALQYVSQWAAQHPERKPLLVLATDGEPVGCDSNTPQDIADVAARALAGPHAIRTLVIGVGSSLVSLNLVAAAGGTERAFLVDTGGDVKKDFADALDQIRGAASSCDFSIPNEGSTGTMVDPTKVNVSYTPNGGTAKARVPQTFMGDPNNCDEAGGWYYDNPAAPTMIKLCDATCRSLSGGAIEVEFGCDTIVQRPR